MKEFDNENNVNENENIINIEKDDASPANLVALLLQNKEKTTDDLKEANDILKDYEKNYNEAKADNASTEAKAKFAAQSVMLQNALKNYLTKLQKSNPEAFKFNQELADINAAYATNSHITVDALQNVGGDVFGLLIKMASDNASKNNVPDAEKQEQFQSDLARLMYLSHLKYEYDHVEGTDEEKNAWRAEILTELISDQFEENIEKFKSNQYFQEVMKEHNRLIGEVQNGNIHPDNLPSVSDTIYQAFHDRADEKYNSVYHIVQLGIPFWGKNEEEQKKIESDKKEVREVFNDIDLMKGLFSNIAINASGSLPEDFVNDPVFDTLSMKRQSGYDGKYYNAPKVFRNRKKLEADKKILVEGFRNLIDIPGKIASFDNLISDTRNSKDPNAEVLIKEYEKAKKPLIDAQNEIYENFKKLNIPRDDIEFTVSAIEKKRNAEKKNKKYLTKLELNTLITAEVDRLMNTIRMRETEEDRNRILSEAERYKGAKANINDKDLTIQAKNALEEIRTNRERRTNHFMKEDSSLHNEVTWKNKKVYIAKKPNDAILSIENNYNAYVKEYNDNSVENRDTVTKSLQEFSRLDERNSKGYIVPKADRSNVKIPEFHVQLKAERAIDEFAMAKVQIDPDLIVPVDAPEEDAIIPGPANDPTIFIDQAFAEVKEHSFTFRTGSPEYKAIYDGLKELTSRRNPPTLGEEAVNGTLPRYLKILAIMDRYLNRKNDELDGATAKHKSENTNSKKRRLGMQSARYRLRAAIDDIKLRNNIKDDMSMANLRYQLEYEKEYNKLQDGSVAKVIDALKSGDRKEAQAAVEKYLVENVDKYKTEDGYSFKLDVDGVEQKIRIPKENKNDNSKERIYAIMLRGYEELVKSNCKYYTDHKRAELPDFICGIQHFATVEKDGVTKDINVNEKLGTNVDTNGVELDFTLNKTNNIKEYADQFEDYYKYMISEFKNEIYDEALDPEVADIYRMDYLDRPFNGYNMRKLTGAVFSNLYLKAVEESGHGEINIEEIDQNRRKILTLINGTPIRDNIEVCMKKHFRCKKYEEDIQSKNFSAERRKQLRNRLTEMTNKISSPEAFNMHIVGDAVEMTVKNSIENITELLKNARNNKEQLKTELESLSKVTMVAKGVGLSYVLDSFNDELNAQFKGETFDETVKNIQGLAKTKMVQKQVETAKKVELRK